MDIKQIQKQKKCQSCGMPMMKTDDYGDNADGSPSGEYCKTCFRNGEFADKDVSMEKMMEITAKEMVRIMKISEEQAKKDAKAFIPHLSRWKDCNMDKGKKYI